MHASLTFAEDEEYKPREDIQCKSNRKSDTFSHLAVSRRNNDVTEEFKKNTYAVLQDIRSEFTNSYLRYALHSYSNPTWTISVLTVLFFSYLINTWLFTFCASGQRPFWAVISVICLNAVFSMDVVFLIGLKFSKKWRKTLNLVEPDTCRVVIDFVLAMPYSVLYFVHWDVNNFEFHAIPPLMALARHYRTIEYFYVKSSQAGSDQWTTFLFQYLILFVLSVHSCTCIWYLFSYREFDIHKIRTSWTISALLIPTETITDWYLVCAYWSVMCITTNALGDLYPITTLERVVAIFATLLGFLLTTIVFVGSLNSQFLTITTRRSKYVRQLKKIRNHLCLIEMDPDTTKRILR